MKTLKTKFHIFSLSVLLTGVSFAGVQGEADDLLKKGLKQVKKLEHVEAKETFTKIIQIDPSFGEAYLQRALVFKYFKEIDNAIADLKKATVSKGKETQTAAHFELGKIYYEQKQYKDAIVEFSSVLTEQEHHEEALLLRGISKIKNGEFDKAIVDFEHVLKVNPENYEALFEKAVAEIELEKYDIAIQHLDQVIEKQKSYSDAYFYRGMAYYQEGQSDKYKHHKLLFKTALENYNKAIELDPTSEESYFDRGEVKMALHDYIGAIADFKKAIELNPKDLEAHYMKAMCNYHYGYEEVALKEMKEIIEIDPNYSDAHHFIGLYYYEMNDYDKALAEFDKLISIESKHSDSFYYRGLTKLDMGNLDGACADFNIAAKELDDKDSEHMYHKHCLHKKQH